MRAISKLPPHHAVALAILALPQVGAWAQTAPATGTLQTITITAERREENIKDVPNSVSTLSGEFLDVLNTSGQDLRGLSGRVPSLNIESSFGRAFPRFYIRGYGNTDFRLNASQPVSLVYDDVVQENPILKGFPAFDLEQIEVLRGPQGTLFGRNSPAGVVKFSSVKPGKRLEGYGSVGIGSLGTLNLEGAASIPLSSTVSTRISVLSQKRDDWVENDYNAGPTQKMEGYTDNAVRAQLLYEPHKNFSALFNLHARDLDGSARLFRANIIEPGTNDLVAGFDREKVTFDGANESKLKTMGGLAKLRWGLGQFTLHSITGYESLDTFNRGDIDGGFGASFLPALGPGPDSVCVGVGRRHPQAQTADAGVPRRVQLQRPAELARRRVLLQRGLPGRELQLRLAGGQRAGRLPAHPPEERRAGPVRRRALPGHARAGAARRPAFHARQEGPGRAGLHQQRLRALCAERQVHAGRAGGAGARRQPVGQAIGQQHQLGPERRVRAEQGRQPLRPRGHGFPRVQHPERERLQRQVGGRPRDQHLVRAGCEGRPVQQEGARSASRPSATP